MIETITKPQPAANTYKKYIPVLTAACCLASIILFIGINLEENQESWDIYKKWGAPSVTDMFNGSYWGLITSNFLHIEVWHIAFNLYWFWIFGKKIEFESTKLFFALLILSAGLVSALAELAFSDTSGIGLSGIGYALFGYIFIKGKTAEVYKNFLGKRIIILFMCWLVLCIILTQTKLWIVGNAAHIGGLLWGISVAYISRFVVFKQWLVGLGLILLLASSIFWTPFSNSWLSHQAYKLHKNQQVHEAIVIYKKILSRDPGNEFAKTNLAQLEIQKLQEKAFKLHTDKQYNEAREVYNQILDIAPDNQWAKDNLNLLPQ